MGVLRFLLPSKRRRDTSRKLQLLRHVRPTPSLSGLPLAAISIFFYTSPKLTYFFFSYLSLSSRAAKEVCFYDRAASSSRLRIPRSLPWNGRPGSSSHGRTCIFATTSLLPSSSLSNSNDDQSSQRRSCRSCSSSSIQSIGQEHRPPILRRSNLSSCLSATSPYQSNPTSSSKSPTTSRSYEFDAPSRKQASASSSHSSSRSSGFSAVVVDPFVLPSNFRLFHRQDTTFLLFLSRVHTRTRSISVLGRVDSRSQQPVSISLLLPLPSPSLPFTAVGSSLCLLPRQRPFRHDALTIAFIRSLGCSFAAARSKGIALRWNVRWIPSSD